MIHPSTKLQFISEEKGFGVVATAFIPKGTITWVQDHLDVVLTPERLQQMDPIFDAMIDFYAFRNGKGEQVLCWDHAKYVNHSFNSNCLSTPYDFELAIRDIHPGEELTDDYGYLNISEPFHAIDENTNRKVVYPDDLLHFHPEWDLSLEVAMKDFTTVSQPLYSLLSNDLKLLLNDITAGKQKMDSILNCYYDAS